MRYPLAAVPSAAPNHADPTPSRQWTTWLKWLGTLLGFGYVATLVDGPSLWAAASKVSGLSILGVITLMFTSIALGTARFKALLHGYGAVAQPGFFALYRIYLVGFFYNTYLPGAVGGDVVRGVHLKEAFPEGGATAALTVVFVERLIGLSALLGLVGLTATLWPIPQVPSATLWGALGLAMALGTILAVAAARRLGKRLAAVGGSSSLGRLLTNLGRILAHAPPVRAKTAFLACLLLSFAAHGAMALGGHLLLHDTLGSAGVQIDLHQSFVIVPVAMAAAFFPLTVGGAGAREAAFVWLAQEVCNAPADVAAAASLMLFFTQLFVAGCGGLLQLRANRTDTETPDAR